NPMDPSFQAAQINAQQVPPHQAEQAQQPTEPAPVQPPQPVPAPVVQNTPPAPDHSQANPPLTFTRPGIHEELNDLVKDARGAIQEFQYSFDPEGAVKLDRAIENWKDIGCYQKWTVIDNIGNYN